MTVTDKNSIRSTVEKELEKQNGVLFLEPAWVARDFLPPGRRFGLPESQYNLGERGGISERWLASTTDADNRVKVPYEGLSFLALASKERVTLKDAVAVAPEILLGKKYAAGHPRGLDRLAKLFDYKYAIPYHLHQMKKHAELVGRNPKEEAYYFPEGVDMGSQPETYFGVHPSIYERKQYEILLPYLEQWNSDLILRHSRAFKLVPDDGWHVPAGILHSPGTAVTVELQEDSDVFAVLQATTKGGPISKELLYKDVRPEDRRKFGERVILDMIDWKANGEPYFFENHHTPPVLANKQSGGDEYWIFYNTRKFSGKKITVHQGKTFKTRDKGVYSVFVWKGKGKFDGHEIASGRDRFDELLISHHKAVQDLTVENTGADDLILFKFFGPDVNDDVPMLKKYRAS